MSRRVTVDRPISPAEIAVIQVMLERAGVDPAYQCLSEGIERLRVVDRCDCGCDSVDFTLGGQSSPSTVIADGTGQTPAGVEVGVIVWGTADAVTGIEVYGMAPSDDLRLPTPQSIRPG